VIKGGARPPFPHRSLPLLGWPTAKLTSSATPGARCALASSPLDRSRVSVRWHDSARVVNDSRTWRRDARTSEEFQAREPVGGPAISRNEKRAVQSGGISCVRHRGLRSDPRSVGAAPWGSTKRVFFAFTPRSPQHGGAASDFHAAVALAKPPGDIRGDFGRSAPEVLSAVIQETIALLDADDERAGPFHSLSSSARASTKRRSPASGLAPADGGSHSLQSLAPWPPCDTAWTFGGGGGGTGPPRRAMTLAPLDILRDAARGFENVGRGGEFPHAARLRGLRDPGIPGVGPKIATELAGAFHFGGTPAGDQPSP